MNHALHHGALISAYRNITTLSVYKMTKKYTKFVSVDGHGLVLRQNSGDPVLAQEIRQQTLENFLAFKVAKKQALKD